MKKLLTCISLLVCLTGCSLLDTPIDEINKLKKPIVIVAISGEGVLLQGADGKILFYNSSYYIAKAISNSGYKTGDIFIDIIKDKN
jgi:hypothetical protein